MLHPSAKMRSMSLSALVVVLLMFVQNGCVVDARVVHRRSPSAHPPSTTGDANAPSQADLDDDRLLPDSLPPAKPRAVDDPEIVEAATVRTWVMHHPSSTLSSSSYISLHSPPLLPNPLAFVSLCSGPSTTFAA